jgi:WhiB family transcriptional regulator, redox-sensing transcriptional regulator
MRPAGWEASTRIPCLETPISPCVCRKRGERCLHRCNYTNATYGEERGRTQVPVDIVTTLYGRQERSWQLQANCMGVDPDLFFPERGASTREAKEVCRGCVVREDCLEYALANGEKFGIWGGMSERERRRLRRARALARRDVVSAS